MTQSFYIGKIWYQALEKIGMDKMKIEIAAINNVSNEPLNSRDISI